MEVKMGEPAVKIDRTELARATEVFERAEIKLNQVGIIKKQGAKIKKGDIVFRIYAQSESKLRKAEKIYNATGGPIRLGGMVIEKI